MLYAITYHATDGTKELEYVDSDENNDDPEGGPLLEALNHLREAEGIVAPQRLSTREVLPVEAVGPTPPAVDVTTAFRGTDESKVVYVIFAATKSRKTCVVRADGDDRFSVYDLFCIGVQAGIEHLKLDADEFSLSLCSDSRGDFRWIVQRVLY